MNELEDIKCSLCVHSEEDLLMETLNTHGSHFVADERYNLVKCRNCGLVYINPRPKQKEIGKFYAIGYYNTGNRFKKTLEKIITRCCNLRKNALIAKYKRSGKLLDIGCGAGDFLLSISTSNWELYGIEPNEKGYELSIKRVRGKIFNNNLADCRFPDSFFDIITMWHVFEHIYDPNKELLEIKRILKDDGVLILAMPNINGLGYKIGKGGWFHLDSPRHLYHYDPFTIKKMLNKNGFSVLKMVFPFLEYPLDLFHSLRNLFRENRLVKSLLIAPILIFSLLIKPVASLFKATETMIVFAGKGFKIS